MSSSDRFESPLGTRYSSPAMQELWSAKRRAVLWRKIWLVLAQAQSELGADIPDRALVDMKAHLSDIDLDAVAAYEKQFRHDVMAHIHAFGDTAPTAKPYIHLGATSAFVTDNADVIVMRDGLSLILGRLKRVMQALSEFALENRAMPTVAYTHFQPAQLTTVGKRATLWLYDFSQDAKDLALLTTELPCRGCKGTTGTQASYLEIFDGDHDKVRELDRKVATALKFERSVPVSGQTYSRKHDFRILAALSGLAQSAYKFATDLRLLQHEGELLEPFESDQIGSSAMPYKKNPMLAERICSLARYLISLTDNTAHTAASQWFERTLDDSANRRIVLADAFLAADAILVPLENICSGLVIRERTIMRNVERIMPFMAAERWLVRGVRSGGDRQELHKVIRKHSLAVTEAVEDGAENNLVDLIAADPAFAKVKKSDLDQELNPVKYVGRSSEQVQEFLDEWIKPSMAELKDYAIPDKVGLEV